MSTSSLIIVARLSGNRLLSMESIREARCVYMEEVWIFGAPIDDKARELWYLLQPQISFMDPKLVHKIEMPRVVCGFRADIMFSEPAVDDATWAAAKPKGVQW